MTRLLLQAIGILGLAALIFFAPYEATNNPEFVRDVLLQDEVPLATTTVAVTATKEEDVKDVPLPVEEKPTALVPEPEPQSTTSEDTVMRTQNPYPYAPRTSDALDSISRAALVNIHCVASGRTVGSISGSGVIIDPRGVILTNAHVAQYLLLDSDPQIGISCSIRTGSPARTHYAADILYLPEAWVTEHAKDIAIEKSRGSGEHDFALLLITRTNDGAPLPTSFPYLSPDTREAIAFTDDRVLLAAYPAEFGSGSAVGSDLYISSVFAKIGDLYTFDTGTVDLISLGGIVLAQGGSSGGSTVNAWGHLVGIITTTSEGETTGERNLRAITLAYVNRALKADIGTDLATFLTGDLQSKAIIFMTKSAPALTESIVSEIEKQ